MRPRVSCADPAKAASARGRQRLTRNTDNASANDMVVAYRSLRLESAAIQGIEEEDVRDLDLVAYFSIKSDAELRKSENYRVEMFEHRAVSAKLEEMCLQSVSSIGELTVHVKQLENVGDQRIMPIVHESEDTMALQQ